MTYSEYLVSQKVKYRCKKSYFNFHKVYENGWQLFVYYSKYHDPIVVFGNSSSIGESIDYCKYELDCYDNLHKPVMVDELEINIHLLGLLKAMRNEKYKSVSASTAHFLIANTFCYRLRVSDYEKEFYVHIDKLNCDISQNEHCYPDADEHCKRVDVVEKAMSFLGIVPNAQIF